METAASAPGEAARADEGDRPAGAPPAADALPAEDEAADVPHAPVEEIRLEESWRRWEGGVVAPSGAGEVEAPAREPPRDDVGGGETRGTIAEVSAPPAVPPLMRPLTPPAPGVAQRERHDDGRMAEGASAEAGSVGAPLARPPAAEKGRRAAAVKESLRPRVERVRDASMGVLEEAAEDSGLRFVLIALALFAVFLVFLFINNLVR